MSEKEDAKPEDEQVEEQLEDMADTVESGPSNYTRKSSAGAGAMSPPLEWVAPIRGTPAAEALEGENR
jgi:hypothetical protein